MGHPSLPTARQWRVWQNRWLHWQQKQQQQQQHPHHHHHQQEQQEQEQEQEQQEQHQQQPCRRRPESTICIRRRGSCQSSASAWKPNHGHGNHPTQEIYGWIRIKMVKDSDETHLSSPRPKQSRKTPISSLPLLCWVDEQSKRIFMGDYLRIWGSADMVSLRSKAALPTGTHTPLCPPAASFLKPPHPYSHSAPRPLSTHQPNKPSTRKDAPTSLPQNISCIPTQSHPQSLLNLILHFTEYIPPLI